MNKILALVWFFGFWSFELIEQSMFGKYNFDLGGSVIFMFLWLVPVIYLLTK